jgi:hypothetical protein
MRKPQACPEGSPHCRFKVMGGDENDSGRIMRGSYLTRSFDSQYPPAKLALSESLPPEQLCFAFRLAGGPPGREGALLICLEPRLGEDQMAAIGFTPDSEHCPL